jgi:hypothetical protein
MVMTDWRWPTEREEQLRDRSIRRSYEQGQTCGCCGTVLSKAMRVYRANATEFIRSKKGREGSRGEWVTYVPYALFCRKCTAKVWPWDRRRRPVECQNCGRLFMLLTRYAGETREPRSCCAACENRLAYAGRRVAPTERPCVVCGESFTAKRFDARICGPACRNKALRRKRKAATAGPTSTTPR